MDGLDHSIVSFGCCRGRPSVRLARRPDWARSRDDIEHPHLRSIHRALLFCGSTMASGCVALRGSFWDGWRMVAWCGVGDRVVAEGQTSVAGGNYRRGLEYGLCADLLYRARL